MGRCFPKPTYYSCPPLAVELPERMLSASSPLSSVLWRPCHPPALGTAVTGHKEIPEMSYNQSCLATAAGELLGGPAPSGHLCWQFRYLCSSLQLAIWEVYMSEAPPTSLLTPVPLLDVWQGFAVTHMFGSYKRMTTQFIWSNGT